MANKKKHANPGKQKKAAKKPSINSRSSHKKLQRKVNAKTALSNKVGQSSPAAPLTLPPLAHHDSRVFTIELDSIRAETTIGDLIVAFPRTRDVLMKHGLRFDVEEAGYLYMSLNVFSAIHGLALPNLIQELDIASKELPPPPLVQPLRQIAPSPTT